MDININNNCDLIKMHDYDRRHFYSRCWDLVEVLYEKDGKIYFTCKRSFDRVHCDDEDKFCISELNKININETTKFHSINETFKSCKNLSSSINEIYYDPKRMTILVKCTSDDCYADKRFLCNNYAKILTDENINAFISKKYNVQLLNQLIEFMNDHHNFYISLYEIINNHYDERRLLKKRYKLVPCIRDMYNSFLKNISYGKEYYSIQIETAEFNKFLNIMSELYVINFEDKIIKYLEVMKKCDKLWTKIDYKSRRILECYNISSDNNNNAYDSLIYILDSIFKVLPKDYILYYPEFN